MADDHKKTLDDEMLIREVLSGEIVAFGIIVERYWNMVVALAMSRVADPTEAEDIAQDSFLKAYSHLHSLKDRSRFAGWLAKIAMQECSNTVRRDIRSRAALGGRVTDSEVLDAIPARWSNPGLSGSQIQFIRRMLRQMPAKLRKIIVMRFVAGLSCVQIAEQLGKRPGTVRVWLHRAYNILRKELAPVLEEIES